jgi:hypothetical protein
MFGQEGEDAQDTAAAVRSIVAAVTTLIQTLSIEDEAEQNLSTFRIFTMETEEDAEIAQRFVFLDRISQRVVAHKPANERWIVEVDDAPVQRAPAGDDTPSVSGSRDLPSPIQRYSKPEQQEDPEAACMICLSSLFAFNEDGSAAVRYWRRLLCPTVWGVTDHTPTGHVHRHIAHDHCAQRWFIFNQKNQCPACRHDFSDYFFPALLHEVVDGVVQWSELSTAARRLAALRLLADLCEEPSASIARAIAFSLADGDGEIVCAAARTIRILVVSIDCQRAMLDAGACEAVVHALSPDASDNAKAEIFAAIPELAKDEDCRRALFAAGACQAAVHALSSDAIGDKVKQNCLGAIGYLARDEVCCRAMFAAGVCEAAVHALSSVAGELRPWSSMLHGLSRLAKNRDCRHALAAALVDSLSPDASDVKKAAISSAIHGLTRNEEGRRALFAAGACNAVVRALSSDASGYAKEQISRAISQLAKDEDCRCALFKVGGWTLPVDGCTDELSSSDYDSD